MTKIIIREAENTDSTAIMALAKNVVVAHVLPTFTNEGRDLYFSTHEQEDAAICDKSKYKTYIACIDKKIVGCIAVKNNYIAHLYVETQHQGRNIGKTLLNTVIANTNEASLNVRSSLNAASFYEKVGFIKTGDQVNYNGIKTIPMELRL